MIRSSSWRTPQAAEESGEAIPPSPRLRRVGLSPESASASNCEPVLPGVGAAHQHTRVGVNQDSLEIELTDGATITDLKNELVKQFPQFESMREHLLVAVDAEYAKEDQVLMSGSEVALIPPVSGG